MPALASPSTVTPAGRPKFTVLVPAAIANPPVEVERLAMVVTVKVVPVVAAIVAPPVPTVRVVTAVVELLVAFRDAESLVNTPVAVVPPPGRATLPVLLRLKLTIVRSPPVIT